jgi:hypothetical protein
MDKEVVELMSLVCQKLAHARVCLSEVFGEKKPEEYFRFRELVFDCEEIMAKYCDCAPIKLIAGQIDEIIENYNKETANNA